MRKKDLDKEQECDNCGEKAKLQKTLIDGAWEWWCQECLEDDEDGYVIQITQGI